ncbi:MAG TPA: hypothetical protein VGP15_14080 [Burkholderiales bacterium]|jgi:hypothetical protein|nr:hypothetical protein [Burkholderiales bacterium]
MRSYGPYVLMEVFLPGGTLLALLLWLSQRFMRNGLSGVRQHLFAQAVSKPLITAKPEPGEKALCLCHGQTAILTARPAAFRQSCETRTALEACCAANADFTQHCKAA